MVLPAVSEQRWATQIIVGYDAIIAEWVRTHLPDEDIQYWGPCTAIGIAIGDELVAGIVYSLYHWPSIEASIASLTPRWASRRNLAAIFAYPFRQLECRRLGATTQVTNQRARAFLCRLGFVEEGVCRQLLPTGDAVIYGMLRAECRWLPPERQDTQAGEADVERQGRWRRLVGRPDGAGPGADAVEYRDCPESGGAQ